MTYNTEQLEKTVAAKFIQTVTSFGEGSEAHRRAIEPLAFPNWREGLAPCPITETEGQQKLRFLREVQKQSKDKLVSDNISLFVTVVICI